MNIAQGFSKIAVGLDCLGTRRLERRAVASTRKRGYGVFDAGTALIRYRIAGRGRPIVFAADPPIVLEQYDELVRELEVDHRVAVIELPGFGFSAARSGFDFSLPDMTRVVTSFLDALGSAPFVLAFPCAAAYSAIAIANDRPELVSAVVLAQAPSWREELAWKARRDPKGILSTPFLGQLALRARRRKRSPEWFRAAAGSPRRCDQFIETTDAAFGNGATFSLASAFQRFFVEAPSLAPVKAPALFIWGLRDRSHKRTDRSSSRMLAPEARLVEASELGHFPDLEDPAWFGRTVRAFLDETVRTGELVVKYYAVAEMRLVDRAWVPAYVQNVTKLVEAHGGRYLARTSSIEQIEGDRESPNVVLLIEWPSKEAALTFYESAEYAPYRTSRLKGAENHFWLVAGKDDARQAQG